MQACKTFEQKNPDQKSRVWLRITWRKASVSWRNLTQSRSVVIELRILESKSRERLQSITKELCRPLSPSFYLWRRKQRHAQSVVAVVIIHTKSTVTNFSFAYLLLFENCFLTKSAFSFCGFKALLLVSCIHYILNIIIILSILYFGSHIIFLKNKSNLIHCWSVFCIISWDYQSWKIK